MTLSHDEGRAARRTPSIHPLDTNELRDDLRAVLDPRAERLGYVGEFFRTAAHDTDALLAFMAFTDALRSTLATDLTEVIALTVARRLGNDYELNQHERLCLARGFDREWVGEVTALTPETTALLTLAQRQVQILTLAVIARHGHNVEQELDAVVNEAGDRVAVAVLLTIGRYVTHAFFVNALELAPPVSSIFSKGTGL
jgi:alkylhydroperoxidase family enzyme